METKICKTCKVEKLLSEFYKDSRRKNSYTTDCRKCNCQKRSKRWSDPVKRKLAIYNWQKNNPEKVKESAINHRKTKKYQQTKLKYERERLKNPLIRISKNCRVMVRQGILEGKGEKTSKSKELIGCSFDLLKVYLEQQFVTDGTRTMSWSNYGKEWHIDHILPCISFNLLLEDEQRKCFHYTNLQPLWKEDNLNKKDKLDWIKPMEKYQSILLSKSSPDSSKH